MTKHRTGDMGRRRQAAYRKGRRDRAEEILILLPEGKSETILERLQAEIKQEGGYAVAERA